MYLRWYCFIQLDLLVGLEERKFDGLIGGVGFAGQVANEAYSPGLIGIIMESFIIIVFTITVSISIYSISFGTTYSTECCSALFSIANKNNTS